MFPAEALAQELRRRDAEVLLLTDDRGLRFAQQFPATQTVVLPAANPNVRGLRAKAAMAATMASGIAKARSALKRFGAQICVGFGGYPSAPGMFAAKFMKLPFGVHEQNAILGRVNRRAAPGAEFVAHGFSRLERLPETSAKVVHLGNPVRDAVRRAAERPYEQPDPEGPIRLLIFGGSQGASLFGRVFPSALAGLPEALRRRLVVTHQVADADHETVKSRYATGQIRVELAPFFTDLPARIAAAHFVISRAGASTVTELGVIGRPALLVPLGIAMDDHQRFNAEVLADAGAADIMLEKDATADAAAALLSLRLGDPVALARAAGAAKGKVPTGAAGALADLVEDLLGG
jgi:UDP-N-acetylglucosamine--N-acetylmuramyl-(pentapeptide) pyrophosphoryl-undecaprenol N-acetylglucosamine transferase